MAPSSAPVLARFMREGARPLPMKAALGRHGDVAEARHVGARGSEAARRGAALRQPGEALFRQGSERDSSRGWSAPMPARPSGGGAHREREVAPFPTPGKRRREVHDDAAHGSVAATPRS